MLKFTRPPNQVFKVFVYLFIIIIPNSRVFAQNTKLIQTLEKDVRVEKFILNKNLNTPTLIKLKEGNDVLVKDEIATLKQLLSVDLNIAFVPLNTIFNKDGITVNKFQQYYKNIKVQHGVYSAIISANKIQAFTGEYYDLKNINITADLTESQALVFAKNFVHAQKYAWEQAKEARDNENDLLKKQLYNAAFEKLIPHGELVIVKDLSQPTTLDLSYKFDIYAAAPLTRGYVYVNAHTGKIMLYDMIIKHLSPDQKKDISMNAVVPEVASIMAGNGSITTNELKLNSNQQNSSPTASVLTLIPTRYAGRRLMGTKQVSGNDPSGNGALIVSSTNPTIPPYVPGSPTYVLIDDTHHSQTEQTYDLNGVGGAPVSAPGVYMQAKSFTDVNNTWDSLTHNRGNVTNEAENDDYAFDAHWGAGVVYDFWNIKQNRKSYDNLNTSIQSYVHYGTAYDNAFWNGSVMTYGDGSYQNGAQAGFAPLTSLDVCGHEIGHGVCSNTADLVYQGESGAMNEGFSDVWAACIENYALLNVDATLASNATTRPNGFKIWSIGEQIDANDVQGTAPNLTNRPSSDPLSTALRYMDDPNRAGDPASYAEKKPIGTRRWKDPNCTAPSLANDQCGVHTNSGVLNHLMYNLTMGTSNMLSSARFVNTVNAENTSGALDGEPYNVTGIGFEASQKIMYLTELMLTPNATYLQARNASVTAAEILYGKCSFEWKQTIVAWHSVALGKSSDTSLCSSLPKFSVSLSSNNISEATLKSAANCTDAVNKIDLAISILAPGVTNPLTITITPTGTASLDKDYFINSTTVNYTANETGLKKVVIQIYNDAEVEGNIPETITLAVHATDGSSFTRDTTVTISIIDDDAVPVIGIGRTDLLVENFDGTTGTSLPTGWNMIDRLGGSSISWKTSTNAASNGFTTKAAFVTLNAAPTPTPAYDPSAGGEVMLVTKQIDATGKSDLVLSFLFAAGGEPSGNGTSTLDFGQLLYSFDGINFQPFQFNTHTYNSTPNATRDTLVLPSTLSNKKFYIGFDWYNDANVAVNPGFIIDSVKVTGGTQQIEKQLNDGVSETQYANKDIYYTSAQDGQVLARIYNNSADLGCVNATVTEAGNGTAANITYNGSTYQRAKKVFTIIPSLPSVSTTYNLTLYITAAELVGLTASSIHILKIKDGTPTSGALSNVNVTEFTPVFTDNSADGYYTYTINGATGFSQFVFAFNTTLLSQKILSFNVVPQNNKFIKISWSTTNETDGKHIIERSIKGANDFKIINEQAVLGGNNVNNYSYNDNNVSANVVYQYRLKSVENNFVTYSAIKQGSITENDSYIEIAPNPSTGMFTISLNGYSGMSDMIVYSATGQLVYQSKKLIENNTSFSIDLTKQPAGIYSLKIKTNTGTEVYKLIVQ